MKYISTRGEAPELGFNDVVLTGLARDGGLYVPKVWPTISPDEISSWKGLSYAQLAVKVMTPFVEGSISEQELSGLAEKAYANFDHVDVAPLVKLNDNEYVLELFHGPTLAFKDYALQFLGHMFDHILKKRGQQITIVGATSGDTGSAAIEACRDRDAIEIFILHPEGKVSEVQRRQMTTVLSDNVHNIALKGTFDDCQNTVKALFDDNEFRDRVHLSAVNSINWARILAQVVYYFYSALQVGAPDKKVSFAVPTGNFGNVFAGFAATKMGLPVEQLIIGSNANDVLIRFIESGKMELRDVVHTISPSMDIGISSNFERLLFELSGRDGKKVSEIMAGFAKTGSYAVDDDFMKNISARFDGARFDDVATKKIISDVYGSNKMLLDPHSAIGLGAAREKRNETGAPMIVLATAHPAKFPGAVVDASGEHPELPGHLSDLLERVERSEALENSVSVIREYIEQTLSERNKSKN